MESPLSGNIVKRHSIRSFRSDDLSKKDLEAIITAGLLAPSSKNRQPWHILVLSNDIKNKATETMRDHIESVLRESSDDEYARDLKSALRTMDIIDQAPIVLAIEYVDRIPYRNTRNINDNMTDRMLVDTLSIGACIENMILEATERGIGSLWIGDHLYAERKLAHVIGSNGCMVSMVALGYPSTSAERAHVRADDRVTYL